MQCGAKKRNGEPCKSLAMSNGRCRMHGGSRLAGIASKSFTNGKDRKYLPKGVLGTYEDARADTRPLSVLKDIELIDTLILGKLGNLDTGESAQHWIALLKAVIDARKALNKEDYGELHKQLDEMEALADKRRLHYATEQEIASQLEQRRKLVDTEQKIILGKQQAITAQEAMMLMTAVLESVRRNVTDDTAIRNIQADFIFLTGGTIRQRIDENTSIDSDT